MSRNTAWKSERNQRRTTTSNESQSVNTAKTGKAQPQANSFTCKLLRSIYDNPQSGENRKTRLNKATLYNIAIVRAHFNRAAP